MDNNENVEQKEEEEEDEENIEMERLNDFQMNHNYIFRLCLLGDSNAGKTSLLTRFCDNSFKESYNNTIGVDFKVVTLKYKNKIIKERHQTFLHSEHKGKTSNQSTKPKQTKKLTSLIEPKLPHSEKQIPPTKHQTRNQPCSQKHTTQIPRPSTTFSHFHQPFKPRYLWRTHTFT